MGGGYLQLAAIGEQDIYLTGNPQITFFKVVYRRHTNFSIDLNKQSIIGDSDFGNKFKVDINRNGDLLSNIYMDVEYPQIQCLNSSCVSGDSSPSQNYATWTNGVGYALIEECDIYIGQNKIDTQNGEWLHILNQVTEPEDNNNSAKYFRQIVDNNNNVVTMNPTLLHDNNLDTLTGAVGTSIPLGSNITKFKTRSITPLQFWFCKAYGLAVPLISLNNLNITLNFKNRKFEQLINYSDEKPSITDGERLEISIWAEYVYLDADERRKFSMNEHEYLIEQIQEIKCVNAIKNKAPSLQINLKNITNCVKALFWVPHLHQYVQSEENKCKYAHKTLNYTDSNQYGNNWFNYSMYYDKTKISSTDDLYLFKCGRLKLNNENRTPMMPAMYFANIVPKRYFNCVPFNNYIYMYSFALNPLDHQPSGSCNFSRFDSVTLELDEINTNTDETKTENTLSIYAITYNLLKIYSGNAQLKF